MVFEKNLVVDTAFKGKEAFTYQMLNDFRFIYKSI